MFVVAVTMAGLVAKTAGKSSELLIGRCVFICAALFKKHSLMHTITGALRVQFRRDSMGQNRGERKVSFAKAFRTHAAPFKFWRDYSTA